MNESIELREIPFRDETVFQGILIRVNHMMVKLPDGRTAKREIIHHNGGVGVVPVDADGNVTLVRQHRIALDQVMLEIPAGKLDSADEDPLLAAHRELEEETGLRAERMVPLITTIPTPGYCNERLFLYLATGLSQYQAHLDADEFVRAVKMPLSKAVSMVMRGELCDAKSALALLMAERML